MDRKNRIIEQLESDGLLYTLFKNMGVRSDEMDDLKQEIYVILLEYNEDKLIQLYEKKQLKFFLVRIITNQYFSGNSPYYKKYKRYYTLVDGNIRNNEMEENNDDDGCECD